MQSNDPRPVAFQFADTFVQALLDDGGWGMLELYLNSQGEQSSGDFETDKTTAWDTAVDLFRRAGHDLG